jgi:hypothetical protein
MRVAHVTPARRARGTLAALILLAAGLAAAPAGIAHAGPAEGRQVRTQKVEDLVKQQRRPTPSQLRKAYRGRIPDHNPFTRNGDGAVQAKIRAAAKLIAVLERSYPGATYLPLGRDAVMMADVMEAYYTHLGQPHRVARIDASSSSFNGNQQDIIDFLKHNTPIDFSDPKKSKGFVLFDNTSYGTSSQSHLVMNAIYAEYARHGYDMAEVHKKIGIVSTYTGLSLGDASTSGETLKSYFETEKQNRSSSPAAPPSQAIFAPEVQSSMYGNEWHGSWGAFTRDASGKVRTEPLSDGAVGTHEAILADFHDVLAGIESGELQRAVEEESAALGGHAPHHRH